jgi:putative sigma-54 modulation protein
MDDVDLDVVVRGKNRAVSTRLKDLTSEKVVRIARFAHDARRVEVEFSELRNPRVHDRQVCEITVHLTRHLVKARAAATEPVAALDLVVAKVEHQVGRIKDKRVARSHPRRNGHGGPVGGDLDDEDDGLESQIMKRKRFAAKPMTTDEAVLQMDLLGHAFFLFTNTETGHAALLYRRHDGALGLIDATA